VTATHIELVTEIAAPIERCFDLARDIDLHKRSMASSKEVAVAGVTTGLIGGGDFVRWEARHLGVRWRVTSRITIFDPPHSFGDEMESGPYKSFRHAHRFVQADGRCVMHDTVDYVLPYGILGRLADLMFARRYLVGLLRRRNEFLKREAETGS
jgi:ligand-binding SRPBCC domain-containing protein